MGNKYYVIIDNEQLGPYSLEELKIKKINKNTLVWTNGFEDWIPAKMVEELQLLVDSVPPPIPKQKEIPVLIKTDDPIMFEDNLKKEELKQKKEKGEYSKKMAANELKRLFNYLKISAIVGLIVFLITFGYLEGFKFLPDYFNKKKFNLDDFTTLNDLTTSKRFLKIKDWNKYEVQSNKEYEKWSKLLSLDYVLSENDYNNLLKYRVDLHGSMYSDKTLSIYNYNNQDLYFEIEFDFKIVDKNGKMIDEFNDEVFKSLLTIDEIGNPTGNENEYTSSSNKDYYEKIKNGEIKRINEISSIKVIIQYGRIIQRNIEYAFKNALLWGAVALIIVFPGIYLFTLLLLGLKRSKAWVDKNAV